MDFTHSGRNWKKLVKLMLFNRDVLSFFRSGNKHKNAQEMMDDIKFRLSTTLLAERRKRKKKKKSILKMLYCTYKTVTKI